MEILSKLIHEKKRLLARQSGFTLVELIVVIMIIGVITAGALPGFFQNTRLEKFRNKVNAVVSMLEQARTQALASELDSSTKNIPPGGYGVYLNFPAAGDEEAILFIDDWNESEGKAVNVDYFETANRVVPDGIFTRGSDTIVDTLQINDPAYLGFGKIWGDEIAADGTLSDWDKDPGDSGETVTVIFKPPYADTYIIGSDSGGSVDLQTFEAKFELKIGGIARKIRLNRITTTSELIECSNITNNCLAN